MSKLGNFGAKNTCFGTVQYVFLILDYNSAWDNPFDLVGIQPSSNWFSNLSLFRVILVVFWVKISIHFVILTFGYLLYVLFKFYSRSCSIYNPYQNQFRISDHF